MTHAELEQFVVVIEPRLTHVEQILPTLLTRDEFVIAMARVDRRFDELRDELRTEFRHDLQEFGHELRHEFRHELHGALAEHSSEIRRHFDVVAESMRSEIRLIAEGHGSLVTRLERLEAKQEGRKPPGRSPRKRTK